MGCHTVFTGHTSSFGPTQAILHRCYCYGGIMVRVRPMGLAMAAAERLVCVSTRPPRDMEGKTRVKLGGFEYRRKNPANPGLRGSSTDIFEGRNSLVYG